MIYDSVNGDCAQNCFCKHYNDALFNDTPPKQKKCIDIFIFLQCIRYRVVTRSTAIFQLISNTSFTSILTNLAGIEFFSHGGRENDVILYGFTCNIIIDVYLNGRV
jgi:hypothetical protein